MDCVPSRGGEQVSGVSVQLRWEVEVREAGDAFVRSRERERRRERVVRGMGTLKVGWCKYRIFIAIVIAVSITAGGLLGFHKPLLKGCIMTYMYPTYIPVPLPSNATGGKYSLYLYHEGWKKIDYQLHLVKLSGVPVLFIPGNGGSYKQVSFPIEI